MDEIVQDAKMGPPGPTASCRGRDRSRGKQDQTSGRQQENVHLKTEDNISEADWPEPDTEPESIDSSAESQFDANHSAVGPEPLGKRRKRERTRSPSHWKPSPMPLRGPSALRQHFGPWTHGPQAGRRADVVRKVKRVPRTLDPGTSDRSRGDAATLVPRGPPGMAVYQENVHTHLRKGVKQTGSALRQHFGPSNLLITQVLLGDQCEAGDFMTWLSSSGEHIAVVTLTKPANCGGSDLKNFFMLAEGGTMRDMYKQDGGHEDQIKEYERATAKFGTKLKTAVAAAVKDQFVLSISMTRTSSSTSG